MCSAQADVRFVPIADMAQESASRLGRDVGIRDRLVALAVLVLHRLLFCGTHLRRLQFDGELI